MSISSAPSRIANDLAEALQKPDCAICRLVERDLHQYVDGFFYESITVVERRAEIRAARGFCPAHGAILAGHSRTLGTAIIHHDVLNDVLRSFPDAEREIRESRSTNLADALRRLLKSTQQTAMNALRPRRSCVLCTHERHQERVVLETLLEGLRSDGPVRTAFITSDGLCLPHLQAALEKRSVRAESARTLIELQGNIMHRLRADLALFIHKHNGSYESSAIGDESRAPARATRMVSGRKPR